MNKYYQDVVNENKKASFALDVYNQEFLKFVPKFLETVAKSNQIHTPHKMKAIEIGRKVGFEIIARLPASATIEEISQRMIDILRKWP